MNEGLPDSAMTMVNARSVDVSIYLSIRANETPIPTLLPLSTTFDELALVEILVKKMTACTKEFTYNLL